MKGGHGIYLVFWFGAEHTPRSPSGARPDAPAALQAQLEASLSNEERRKISVCVVDVSQPSPRPVCRSAMTRRAAVRYHGATNPR